jgi:hypothetical protein
MVDAICSGNLDLENEKCIGFFLSDGFNNIYAKITQKWRPEEAEFYW